jgi:uncharacterized protein YdiU (UPF0061 family)
LTAKLPADRRTGNQVRPVLGAAYSRVHPVEAPEPRIVAWSKEMSDELGLDDEVWASEEAALVFTGSRLLPGSDPHAANYGGHQFGTWAGQLGDGRAIALGEVVDPAGQSHTLQLKGAGPTPYSRRADGLAVLRSSIREFLCSEAMHHLGVPTTRALSLATTGTEVIRDMLYDGNPGPEPGAVVCRVAPSFIRFGNFQLFAARGELDQLRLLADFTIANHFRYLGEPSPTTYVAWFEEVCRLSCELVVEWMRVGFVHGVLNTDNMSIHGLTIDYGPYGWVDDFDPGWTPNTTDAAGRRYRFGYQPQIVQWNLLQLANALYPLIDDAQPLEAALNGFADAYHRRYRAMMLAKLGLSPSTEVADDELISGLIGALQVGETDMTLFFRRLATTPVERLDGSAGSGDPLGPDGIGEAFYRPSTMTDGERSRVRAWLASYARRVRDDEISDPDRTVAMNRVNPRYVLRNYLAQQAIDRAEQGDSAEVMRLLDALRHPYDDQPALDACGYGAKRPDWARNRPGCSMLSCSS